MRDLDFMPEKLLENFPKLLQSSKDRILDDLFNAENIMVSVLIQYLRSYRSATTDATTLQALDALDADRLHENPKSLIYAVKDILERQGEVSLVALREALTEISEVEVYGWAMQVAEHTEPTDSLEGSINALQRLWTTQDSIMSAWRLLADVCQPCTHQEFQSAMFSALGRLTEISDRLDASVLEPLTMPEMGEQTDRACMLNEAGRVPTGLVLLDYLLEGGYSPSSLNIIAARPGVGKTALAISMVRSMKNLEHPVLFFSLEMSATALTLRLYSAMTGRSVSDIQVMARKDPYQYKALIGRLWEQELKDSMLTIQPYASSQAKYKWLIQDKSGLSVEQICSTARRIARLYGGLTAVFVDYLQILGPSPGRKFENRNLEVGHFTRCLKALAKELAAPVVALCQLNRKSESRRKGEAMQLSDLRESGNIEQDADTVLFIQRDAADKTGTARLEIAKNRSGQVGTAIVGFDGRTTSFTSEKPPEGMQPDGSFATGDPQE